HPRPRNVNLTRPVVAGLDTNAARPPASGFAAAAHHRARHRQAEPRVGALPLLVDVGVEDDLLVERDRQPGAGGDLAVELAGTPAAVAEEDHAALRIVGAGGGPAEIPDQRAQGRPGRGDAGGGGVSPPPRPAPQPTAPTAAGPARPGGESRPRRDAGPPRRPGRSGGACRASGARAG